MGQLLTRPKRLGDQVCDLLREMILKEDLKPDKRLKEEELARLLGASRTPVREALQRLEREYLVTRREKGGYKVRKVTDKDFKEAMGVKRTLEKYACERAKTAIKQEKLFRMGKILKAWSLAISLEDEMAMAQEENNFRKELCLAADSDLLVKFLASCDEMLKNIPLSLSTKSINQVERFEECQGYFMELWQAYRSIKTLTRKSCLKIQEPSELTMAFAKGL